MPKHKPNAPSPLKDQPKKHMIGNHSLLKTNNNLTKPSPSNKFSPHLTTKSKSCKIIKENYQEKDELLNTISLLRQELVLKNATVDSLEGQKRGKHQIRN